MAAAFAPQPIPGRGVAELLVSVLLLSSGWPLTKLAIDLGTTPLWFAEGRAILSWALAIIAIRRRPPRASMFELLPWCFLVGAVALGPLAVWRSPHGSLGTAPGAWAILGYIGLIAGPLGTWGVIEATLKLPAVVASVGFLATPAVGILLSNWILGEPITPDLVGGTALILLGVGLAVWPVRRR